MKTKTHKTCLVFCSIFLVIVVISFLCVPLLHAEDETELSPVVVTATRSEQPLEAATASVTVISGKELEEKQFTTVGDALRQIVGVDVVQTGGPGGLTSLFLRGANSQHTLVLVDGIQVNNPTTGGFDFADLTTDNIERIEIIRGPQSTLYGSDAIGGVINIITKMGRGKPTVTFSAEGGSYNTGRGAAAVSGQFGPVDYSLTVSHEETKGFSRAASGSEADGYVNTALSSKIGLSIGDGRLEFTGRYTIARTELDGFNFGSGTPLFGPADDPNAVQRSQNLVLGAQFQKPLSPWWNQTFSGSLNLQRNIHNQFGEFSTSSQRLDWQHDLSMGESLLLTVGSEYEGESGENAGDPALHTITNVGLYGQTVLHASNGYSQVVGVRYDNNNRYGNVFTYKAEAAYLFSPTQTKVRASLGTGFHGPTVQDLFYPGSANPNLKPEKSQTAEAGIEQSFLDKRVVISVTQFRTLFDDLIVFQSDPVNCVPPFALFGACPVNVDRARAEGQEITATVRPIHTLVITAGYTHTVSKNRDTGELLVLRPRGRGHVGISVRPIDPWTVALDIDYVGRRNDTIYSACDPVTFSCPTGLLHSYWLVRFATQYEVTPHLQIFGRVENLTNVSYQETFGYKTAGISAFGGARIRF